MKRRLAALPSSCLFSSLFSPQAFEKSDFVITTIDPRHRLRSSSPPFSDYASMEYEPAFLLQKLHERVHMSSFK